MNLMAPLRGNPDPVEYPAEPASQGTPTALAGRAGRPSRMHMLNVAGVMVVQGFPLKIHCHPLQVWCSSNRFSLPSRLH